MLAPEFYKNLTSDKLEEYIEFVEWPLVPIHLITEEFKIKFSSFKEVVAIFWFKELLTSLDRKEFEDVFFFYKGEKCYMTYDVDSEFLWCLNEEIWSVIKKFGFDAHFFVKNLAEKIFTDIKVIPKVANRISMIQEEFEERVLLR